MINSAVPHGRGSTFRINGSRLAVFVAIGLLVMRAAYAMVPDLFPEEAYYWNYSEHLALGYLDHPPLVSWLIHVGTELFEDGELGVRFFALVCSVITALFAYLTASFFFDRRTGIMGALLVQVLPFFFMTGLIMTPDSSLTACWAGMLYFLTRAIFDQRTGAWWGVGVCLGVGMLSKYTIALLGPATLLFLALDPASRVWFRRAAPYGAVLLAAAIFSPVIIWNAGHQWASFAFQTGDRMAAPMQLSIHQLAASVLLFLTPVGVVLAVKSLRGRAEEPGTGSQAVCGNARLLLFTRVFVLTPLAVFVLFSLFHPVKLNWTGPLWLALIPMLAAQLASVHSGSSFLLRQAWPATVAVLGLAYLALLQYLAFGIPMVAYNPKMELLPVGWSEMGRALSLQKEDCEKEYGRTLVVGLDRNFIASEAAFYQTDQEESIRETTGAHLLGGDSLMYKSWFPAKEQEGATLLLVSFRESDLNKRRILKQCGHLGPIKKYWIERDGIKIRPYYTRTALNYHSEPLAQAP